jgi:hypothetical protein
MKEIIYEIEWTTHVAPHCVETARFNTRKDARARFNELRKKFYFVKFYEVSYERRLIERAHPNAKK